MILLKSEARDIFLEEISPFMKSRDFHLLKKDFDFVRKTSVGAEYFVADFASGFGITPILGLRNDAVLEILDGLRTPSPYKHRRTIVLYCGNQLKNPEDPDAQVPNHQWEASTIKEVLSVVKLCELFVEQYAEAWYRFFSNPDTAVKGLIEPKTEMKITHTTDGYRTALAIALSKNDREMLAIIIESMKTMIATKERIDFYNQIQNKYPDFFPTENPFVKA